MANTLRSAAMGLGLALFTVAGYQTVQYRDYLSMTQQQFQGVPVYVLVETAIAFGLSLWGCAGVAGSFRPINPYQSQRGLDANSHRPDFLSFNHRGHLMPLAADPLS